MVGLSLSLGLKSRKIAGERMSLITLPSAFTAIWNPSFYIYESGRSYSTDFNFDALKPTGATAYITKTGNDTTGDGSAGNPYRTLAKAYTEGASLFMVGEGVWGRTDGFAANFAPARSIAVISKDGAGKAILTRSQPSLTWTQQSVPNDNVYVASRSSVRTVIDTTAAGRSGEYLKDGITPLPIPLSIQTSIANCQANAGSYFISGSNIYVRTWDGRAPDANVLVCLVENVWSPSADITIWMDGMENWGDGGARLILSADNTAVWAWRNSASRFGASASNGLHIDGADYCHSMYCDVTDIMGATDGFNYHSLLTTTTRTKFLEVGCKAVRCGTEINNNMNGTTAHDNCMGIRLNGNYQSTYGPVVADTLGAMTVNLGCSAGNSQVSGTGNGQRSDFQVGTVSAIDGRNSKMWLKNCTALTSGDFSFYQTAGGDLFDWGGNVDNTSQGAHGTITSYS